MKFAKRVGKIAVSAIKQMPLLARDIEDVVSLGQGIPSLKTPAYIRAGITELLEANEQVGKYSLQPGVPELKELLASQLQKKIGRVVDGNSEIFISAGAMEALFCAITSIVDDGDEVILFDPSYASHIEQVLFAGGVPVFVGLNENDNWSVDLELFKKSVSAKTKAIIVCSPGNPTGKVFTESELKEIVKIAKENNIFLIADETYEFLTFDNNKFISLSEFSEVKDLVIACYSFSKKYAMTGWRVGYMYANSEIIDQCLKVHDATVICAPTISQYAALIALADKFNADEDIKGTLLKRRNLSMERLDRLKDLFSYNVPAGAYYILARYLKTDLNSEDFAIRILHEAKVITIPGRAFGPSGERHIRFSFGGTEEQINQAFDRIEKWNKTLVK